MTSVTLRHDRSRFASIAGVVGFALALAAASQVAIPLPGTPVPLTLQPMLVLLAGLMLGPTAGAASMALYLVAGASGLPVFTPGGAVGVARLLGPTGGYLLAYPLAAFVVGRLATARRDFSVRAVAALAGIAVIYAGGLSQLAIITGSLKTAALVGVLPFAAADAVKAFLAAAITGQRGARRDG
jgi:biotin transport system substrate-specific component